jgi:hypothetical protein
MSKKTKSLSEIASQLLEKNPTLTKIIEDNPGASYKAIEPRITGKLCASIGKQEGQYIKRNELIWACIDSITGTEEDLDY